MLPDCEHIWASDHRWWEYHIGDITRDYNGQCWTQSTAWPEKGDSPEAWGIKVLEADTKAPGLSRDKTRIHTGRNSGYAAIGLAYNLGATRILLIGFDMMIQGTKRHWFGDHPGKMNAASNYMDFREAFGTIKPAEYGIEIWNCSRQTALEHFPIYNLDEIE